MSVNKKSRFAKGLLYAGVLAFAVPLCTTFNTAFAAEPGQEIKSSTTSFSLNLGATRVIYNPASRGATLSIDNPHTYPVLMRSQIFTEDRATDAPFLITPPLFRLDGMQKSSLRIVQTSKTEVMDRESLYWLCVTGIPPKGDEAWAQDENGNSLVQPDAVQLNIQVNVQNCIKLFVRPARLGEPSYRPSSLTWTKDGEKLNVTNTTAFYMNLTSVSLGGQTVKGLTYVPPFSSRSFSLPSDAAGDVQWQVINDYGGESQVVTTNLS